MNIEGTSVYVGPNVHAKEPLIRLTIDVKPSYAERLAELGGRVLDQLLEALPNWDVAGGRDADWLEIARRTGLAVGEVMAVIHGLAPHMRVKDDTVELIHDLKACGHRLVYLSNMPHGLARWIEDDHPFADWFEDGIFSARVALMKPDPAIFHAVTEKLALSDTSPVFIDDAQRNIDAAHAVGWRGVRFETAAQVRAQLVDHGLLNPAA